MLTQITHLIQKELRLEWRNKYAINGIMLYLGSTIFICYLSFNLQNGVIEAETWNALFWIIILFAAVNAVSKSFFLERQGQSLYYYMIADPQAVIISKIIYNFLLLFTLGTIGYVLYIIVLGNAVQNVNLFLTTIALASFGFSASLTMISGIASKTSNGSTLMVILGFPVILPILLMAIRIAGNAIKGGEFDASFNDLTTLLAINIISITVAWLLFPALWRS